MIVFGWFCFLRERLPLWIQCDVCAVVVKQIQLNLLPVRLLDGGEEIRVPVIRTDQRRLFRPVYIHSLHRVVCQQACDAFFVGRRTLEPQCVAQAATGCRKAHFIGIRVLNDEPFKQSWRLVYDTEADRTAVVLNIEPEAIKAFPSQEFFGQFGEVIEGIRKLSGVGRIAVAETRIVGRDDVKAIRKSGNQVAIIGATKTGSREAEPASGCWRCLPPDRRSSFRPLLLLHT